MKGPVSIALFFLLSGFFLSALLGAVERSGKLLLASGACLAAVVCVIVFLSPVQWPDWHLGAESGSDATTNSATVSPSTAPSGVTSTSIHYTITTGASSVDWR